MKSIVYLTAAAMIIAVLLGRADALDLQPRANISMTNFSINGVACMKFNDSTRRCSWTNGTFDNESWTNRTIDARIGNAGAYWISTGNTITSNASINGGKVNITGNLSVLVGGTYLKGPVGISVAPSSVSGQLYVGGSITSQTAFYIGGGGNTRWVSNTTVQSIGMWTGSDYVNFIRVAAYYPTNIGNGVGIFRLPSVAYPFEVNATTRITGNLTVSDGVTAVSLNVTNTSEFNGMMNAQKGVVMMANRTYENITMILSAINSTSAGSSTAYAQTVTYAIAEDELLDVATNHAWLFSRDRVRFISDGNTRNILEIQGGCPDGRCSAGMRLIRNANDTEGDTASIQMLDTAAGLRIIVSDPAGVMIVNSTGNYANITARNFVASTAQAFEREADTDGKSATEYRVRMRNGELDITEAPKTVYDNRMETVTDEEGNSHKENITFININEAVTWNSIQITEIVEGLCLADANYTFCTGNTEIERRIEDLEDLVDYILAAGGFGTAALILIQIRKKAP